MKLLPTTDYSLDDIIFEGRLQTYGGYASRKAYPQHVVKATTYMFAAVGLLLIAAHVGLAFKSALLPATRLNKSSITIDTVVIPKTEKQVIEPSATQSSQAAVATVPIKRFVTARIVPDKTPVKEALLDQTDLEEAVGEP